MRQHPSIVEYIGLGAVDHSCPEAEWRTMYLVQEVCSLGGWVVQVLQCAVRYLQSSVAAACMHCD